MLDVAGLSVSVRGEDGEREGLPKIHLEGLSDVDAGKLYDSVVVGPVDAAVRDRIIAETRARSSSEISE